MLKNSFGAITGQISSRNVPTHIVKNQGIHKVGKTSLCIRLCGLNQENTAERFCALSNMLLRTTLSNTKKFFQKTVENFKSFLSGGYERLPKNSPCNSFPCGGGGDAHDHQVKCSQNFKELGKFTREFVNDKQANKGKIIKKKETSPAALPRRDEMVSYDQVETRGDPRKKKIVYEGKRYYQDYSRSTRPSERGRSFLVARKLKELEMLDNGNAEHVLDIEEVLHYYSRLTCPAYVDIVDHFFMDMYSELLNGEASIPSSSHLSNSMPRLQRFGFYH